MNLTSRAIMIKALALCAVAALASPAFGEIALAGGKLSASVESEHAYVSRESRLNPGNVFDIDEGYLDRERFTLGYAFAGERFSLTFGDYGSFSINSDADPENRLGELFGTVKIGTLFLDVGKKRICQSLSYFKSPINFVLDDYSEYELRYSNGRAMISLEYFTDIGFFGFSYIPEIDFSGNLERYVSPPQERQFLARYDASAGDWSIGLALSLDDRWRVGAQISRPLGQYAEAHAELVFDGRKERIKLVESDNPYAPDSVRTQNVPNCLEGVLGLAVHLTHLSVIAEYYGTQAGYTASEWDSVTDRYAEIARTDISNPLRLYNLGAALGAHTGNEGLNGRHYLMLRASNPTTDDYELSLTAMANLQDFGMILMPAVGYSGIDNITVKAGFMKRLGGRYTEYALYGEDWQCAMTLELWI